MNVTEPRMATESPYQFAAYCAFCRGVVPFHVDADQSIVVDKSDHEACERVTPQWLFGGTPCATLAGEAS